MRNWRTLCRGRLRGLCLLRSGSGAFVDSRASLVNDLTAFVAENQAGGVPVAWALLAHATTLAAFWMSFVALERGCMLANADFRDFRRSSLPWHEIAMLFAFSPSPLHATSAGWLASRRIACLVAPDCRITNVTGPNAGAAHSHRASHQRQHRRELGRHAVELRQKAR